MRLFVLAAAIVWTACSPAPVPVAKPTPDLTAEPWYGETTRQLAEMTRDASRLLEQGKPDQAAALITKAQPLEARLLTAARPTLEAMEAASDLDRLYGRMLLSNRHYGWARLAFQKDAVRWKNWRPQTGESLRRFREAQASIAECDRVMTEPVR